jgi:hypothetical protein
MTKMMTFLNRILPSSLLSLTIFLAANPTSAQTYSSNSTGTNNGLYYSFWKQDNTGSASMTIVSKGHYTTTWSGISNFTCGLGWNPGTPDRVVTFSGSFNGGSNGFLALYGWTKNALIEYYVCENHGSWTPPGNTSGIVNKGTFTSDGGTYTIYTATRTNAPSISGTATFQQYWSVRSQTRSSGTITFANHVAAWKKAGMNMGSTWDYQIMETEGYMSSGSSNITLTEGTVTDLEETSLIDAEGFGVYPNPVTDKLMFTLPGSSSVVSLLSGNGTQVMSMQTESPSVEIDMTKYEAGIYLVRVVSDGRTTTKKIMKR